MDTFKQIPIDLLLNNNELSLQTIIDLQQLIFNRKSCEENYLLTLKTTKKKDNRFDNNNSLDLQLDLTNKYHGSVYKTINNYRKEIDTVLALIQAIRSESELHIESEKLVKKAKKQQVKALELLHKSKSFYNDKCIQYERSKLKYISLYKHNQTTLTTATTPNNNNTNISNTNTNNEDDTHTVSTKSSFVNRLISSFDFDPIVELDKAKDKCKKRFWAMISAHEEMKKKRIAYYHITDDYETFIDKVCLPLLPSYPHTYTAIYYCSTLIYIHYYRLIYLHIQLYIS